jgi:hypothetical protein
VVFERRNSDLYSAHSMHKTFRIAAVLPSEVMVVVSASGHLQVTLTLMMHMRKGT